MEKLAQAQEGTALDIRFGPVDVAQVRVRTTDPGAIVDELTGRVATAPRFFEQAAIGIDFDQLEAEPAIADAREVIQAVQQAGLLLIGLVQGGSGIEKLARELRLPVLPRIRSREKPEPEVKPASSASAPAADESHAQMHHQHIRSGQRIYARNRDLVVTTTVGAGAEVIADGCVHVYGALRGRAMAGVHGDAGARMFCQEFYAELVSVAGVFKVFESLPEELAGQPVQAWLDGDDLRLARIGE